MDEGKPENSGKAAPKKAVGKPFAPGQSGNPGGFSKARRAKRAALQAALDAAFTQDAHGNETGTDTLVNAIVAGVQVGDATCIKLACEYRFGKPETDVTLHDGDGDPLGIAQVREAAAELLRDPEQRAAVRAAVRADRGEN